jgi:ubiquinone/menaquinone biosynthesis C-methylase UbiE/GNAT superfamily N-acetyltransferase
LITHNDCCYKASDRDGNCVGFIIAGDKTKEAIDLFLKSHYPMVASALLRNPSFWVRKVIDLFLRINIIRGESPSNSFRLVSIAVAPGHWRKGVGQELLNYLERQLKERNIQHYGLSVKKSNVPAIRFYEKNSFKVEKEIAGSVYYVKTLVSEKDRIKAIYNRRSQEINSSKYSYFNLANLFISHGRECKLIKLFQRFGFGSLEKVEVLDVGCGGGNELTNMIRYGAIPSKLHGIDLLPDRIETARVLNPNIDFVCGDASKLPYEDESMDIVMQYTVFTSILDSKMKRDIAREMLRVLKRDGIILWYDFHTNNPANPNVRGVKKKEIYELFENCDIYLKRITLAPPIARVLAPFSIILCQILEKIPLLCTHYLGGIKKL